MLDVECGKKTCDECIYYKVYQLVCPNCGKDMFSGTNRERWYRSYRCRVTLFIEFDLVVIQTYVGL